MLIPIIPTRSALVFSTATNLTGTVGVVNIGTATVIIKIPTSAILATGSTVRLTMLAGSVAGTFNNVTISNAATSGQAWDSAATPTAVTLDGSASWSIPGTNGQEVMSDAVSFSVTGASALIIAINMAADTTSVYRITNVTAAGVVAYYKAGVAEAGSASRGASYTAFSLNSWGFKKLEVA